MTNHMEAATEAGVKAVDDLDPLNAVRTPHIKAAIIAALPHLSPYMLGEKANKMLDSLQQQSYKAGWNACFKEYGAHPND